MYIRTAREDLFMYLSTKAALCNLPLPVSRSRSTFSVELESTHVDTMHTVLYRKDPTDVRSVEGGFYSLIICSCICIGVHCTHRLELDLYIAAFLCIRSSIARPQAFQTLESLDTRYTLADSSDSSANVYYSIQPTLSDIPASIH